MKKKNDQHVIFLHLPKNGGSTIQSILDRIYRKNKIFTVHWVGSKGNLQHFIEMDTKEIPFFKLRLFTLRTINKIISIF